MALRFPPYLRPALAGVWIFFALGANAAPALPGGWAGAGSPGVLVAAHRGDWRHHPENSIAAIESCLALGVPVVELDVRRTKDGALVLMHDRTVDRTTTGHGAVEELTAAKIQQFYLRDGLGMPTEQRVPTLREALSAARGGVMFNLDKSYELLAEIVPLLDASGMRRRVIFKGAVSPAEARARHGALLDGILFMPVIRLNELDGLDRTRAWLAESPPAIEFVFSEWTPAVELAFALCRERGVRIWVNTLWPQLCGGYSDDRALRDPDAIYGKLLRQGASIFQTDRPRELMDYLSRTASVQR